MGKIIALIGPSGSGKTFFVNHYLNNKYRLITHTTRSIRPDEIQDKDYHFEKEYIPSKNNMLVDKYISNYYWTTKSDIINSLNKQPLTLMIVTKKGFNELIYDSEFNKSIYGIYFKVNQDKLISRIKSRNESDSEKKIRINNLRLDMFSVDELNHFKQRKQNYVLDLSNISEQQSEKKLYKFALFIKNKLM